MYCLDDHRFVLDPFYLDYTHAAFAPLVNLCMQNSALQEVHSNYQLTCMTRHNNCLLYGSAEGLIHLVGLGSLDSDTLREKDPQ